MFLMDGPTYNGDHDRMNEAQVAQHKAAMSHQTDQRVRDAYRVYLNALKLDDKGNPPKAACIQYFIETWRELRKRMRR